MRDMRIVVSGSNGLLGSECAKIFNKEFQVVCPDKHDFDITVWDKVIDNLDRFEPDVVLNCAGITDMQECENDEPIVRKVNVEGPRNLAQASARFGCRMVQVSCGYVFDGLKPAPQPYFEDDPPNPLMEFGRIKLESEMAIRSNSPDYIILRSMWLYGLNGNDFIKWLLSRVLRDPTTVLKIPKDQFGAPTWVYRLSLQIQELLLRDARGTLHATAEGWVSRFDYAQYVLDKLGIEAAIEPCVSGSEDMAIKSLPNGLLENRLIKKQGMNVMVNWKKDLDLFLRQHGEELLSIASRA